MGCCCHLRARIGGAWAPGHQGDRQLWAGPAGRTADIPTLTGRAVCGTYTQAWPPNLSPLREAVSSHKAVATLLPIQCLVLCWGSIPLLLCAGKFLRKHTAVPGSYLPPEALRQTFFFKNRD